MISRRRFLVSGAAAGGLPWVARGATKPLLQMGLIADPQYADVPPLGTRFYRQSIGKLTEAIEDLNGRELDLCVNMGDTIDQHWESFEAILKPLAKSKHKFHHVLGNHDFEMLDAHKAKVPQRLGMERKYYSVERGDFCLVMLDTNDVSMYAHAIDSKETAFALGELNRYARTGAIYAQPWNGAVGEAQMKWLEETCRKAGEARQKVIVFSHHPVLPDKGNHNAWNSPALVSFVERTRNVVAWINGHNHAGALARHAGAPFLTLKGMVETADTNAYAVARLFADRMEITGFGREPSRELVFRKA